MKKITLANKEVNEEITRKIETYFKREINKKELLENFSKYSWEYQVIKDELRSTTIAVLDNGGKYEDKIEYKFYENEDSFIQEKTEFDPIQGWNTKIVKITEEDYREAIEVLKSDKYRVLFEIA